VGNHFGASSNLVGRGRPHDLGGPQIGEGWAESFTMGLIAIAKPDDVVTMTRVSKDPVDMRGEAVAVRGEVVAVVGVTVTNRDEVVTVLLLPAKRYSISMCFLPLLSMANADSLTSVSPK